MSVKYLGQPFDIHTGGIDHIPVHHTNEIAQSEAAAGKPLANYWLHSEFLVLSEGRIGKSEGNAITLEQVKTKGYSPLAYRYFVLGAHYRTKLNFTLEALEGAQNALNNLYSALASYKEGSKGSAEYEEQFAAAVNNDLETPQALAVMWNLVNSNEEAETKFASLMQFDKILGLGLREAFEKRNQEVPKEITELVKQRDVLRNQKRWNESDEIKKKIEADGEFGVSDTSDGTIVIRKK